MEITLVTWNIAGAHPIHSGEAFGYAPENVDYFLNELKRLSPDVVCLQETHLSAGRSIAQEIAQGLGDYSCIEQDNSPSHIDSEYRLGNALLMKNGLIRSEQSIFPYPDFPLVRADGKPTVKHEKGFQVAQFDFGAVMNLQMQPLRFLGTPYDSESGKDFAREMEVQLIQHKSFPMIICGDFNYDNATALYPELLDEMTTALPAGPTRPDNKRTDYIFCSKEFSVHDAGVIQTNTDHYLCWAKLGI